MRTSTAGLAPTVSPALTQHNSAAAKSRVAALAWAGARGLLAVTLFAAPWAFGAVQVWAWATLAVLAFAALFLWAMSLTAQGRLRVVWSPLYVPAALFLVLGLVQYYGHFTLDPFGTREALIKLVTDLIIFFLAGQLWAGASEQTCKRLGLAVALYAFSMALFAILQAFSNHGEVGLIYWRVKTLGGAFGPYVNRDDYAGLMEMLIPLAAAYVLFRPSSRRGGIMLAFCVLVPIASVLLSGSRGGFVSLLVEAGILAAVLFRHGSKVERRGGLAVRILTGVILAVLFLSWLIPTSDLRRLESVTGLAQSPEVTLGERLVVTRDAFGIIRDHPWLGSGLGSFAVLFPKYQTLPTNLVWDHAHDDYVEALSETGIVGGLIMLMVLVLFLRLAFWGLAERLKNAAGWIQLGAALGCCGLLVHSFADFNLHIPANAAWFVVCVALGTCLASSQRAIEGSLRMDRTN